MMGIDEAGRGSVIGDMIYGSCCCPVSREADVKKMGFMDSKTLTDAKRQAFFQTIKRNDWMLQKYSLNQISHDSAIGMIQHFVDRGINITQLYVDAVGNCEYYTEKLQKLFPSMQILVCSKCDALYPICSAGSICAKVTRDFEMSHPALKEPALTLTGSWGSGYPSDQICKDWIGANMDPVFGYPSVVRFSWQPIKEATKRGVPVDWRDDDDDEFQPKLSFGAKQTPAKRFRFFKDRGMAAVTAF